MLTMQSPEIQTAIVGHDAMRRAESSPVLLDRLQADIDAHEPAPTVTLPADDDKARAIWDRENCLERFETL